MNADNVKSFVPTLEITMRDGDGEQIVLEAESALLARGSPIYQRSGELVRPVRWEELKQKDATVEEVGSKGPVSRQMGATVLLSVNEVWLTREMGRAAKWYSLRRRKKEGEEKWVRAVSDPRQAYARTLLESNGEWRFPTIVGVVSAPTLDRDGRAIEVPGYDPVSRLLVDLEPGAFPTVPERPTKDDAVAALKAVDHLLRGFPFKTEEARAVALAAFLTSAIRNALRATPMFAFDAPQRRTGKSLLAETVGIVKTGTKPAAMHQGDSEAEDEKRFSTVLQYCDPIIHIDNCEKPLKGSFLCSMLTQEVVQARILGLSERRILPSTATVLASGNNMSFVGDICARVVPCRLDTGEERPDLRRFDWDVHEEAAADRPRLLVGMLAALRAYHLAGRPEKLSPMGGFEDWAWVRGLLVWNGYADPANAREGVITSDPEREGLSSVMELWLASLGSALLTVKDVEKRASAELRERLSDVACKGEFRAQAVGIWLEQHRDKPVEGHVFQKGTPRNKVATWTLATAARTARAVWEER